MHSLTFENRFLIFPQLWCHINWTNDQLNERKFGLMFIKTNVQMDYGLQM